MSKSSSKLLIIKEQHHQSQYYYMHHGDLITHFTHQNNFDQAEATHNLFYELFHN